jgi:hypothetical protein
MPRKSKKINRVNPNSQEYWNAILAKEGLTLWEGSSPKMSYVEGTAQLERIEGHRQIEKLVGGRRVKPLGHPPDFDA